MIAAVALLFWSRAISAARRLVTPNCACRSVDTEPRSRPTATPRITTPSTWVRYCSGMDLISATFSATAAVMISLAALPILNSTVKPAFFSAAANARSADPAADRTNRLASCWAKSSNRFAHSRPREFIAARSAAGLLSSWASSGGLARYTARMARFIAAAMRAISASSFF